LRYVLPVVMNPSFFLTDRFFPELLRIFIQLPPFAELCA
jgi:hypothetical protein